VPDTTFDVAVVGAGIIGLASAFALTQAGATVCVIDPAPATGASFAAAGMLSPGAEWSPEDRDVGEQMRAARHLWPDFAADLSRAANTTVSVCETGSLFVAWDGSDRREWRRHFDTVVAQGIDARDVDRVSRAELFAGVSPRITAGSFIAADAFVAPDQVLRALVSVVDQPPHRLVRETALTCVDTPTGVSVTTHTRTVSASHGLIATGTERFAPPGIAAPEVRPVRGVTVRLHTNRPVTGCMVRALIEGRSLYVIPRKDGDVVVGATSDENPSATVEAGHVRALLDDAITVLPGLDTFEFVGARVGLRPAPLGHCPFFTTSADSRWAISGGHFRHGFLLAPRAAADAVTFWRGSLS
jgi:glycine oxidase